MIALWIVPIYEIMHEETDRLNILLYDWNSDYPLTDVKLMAPVATNQLDVCESHYGPGYFKLVPAMWEGMAMGCNCTGEVGVS